MEGEKTSLHMIGIFTFLHANFFWKKETVIMISYFLFLF